VVVKVCLSSEAPPEAPERFNSGNDSFDPSIFSVQVDADADGPIFALALGADSACPRSFLLAP
jgi:hypothetical protein